VSAPATHPVRSVVLLHGYEGNGPTHWQTWLADELPGHGVAVRYPLLPDPFVPDLTAWSEALGFVLAADDAAGRVVVAHSLACHLWAHVAAVTPELLADRAVLVAPPGVAETAANFPRLPPGPLDAVNLARAAGRTDVVLGGGDPWRAAPADYRSAGLDLVEVAGGAHLNADAGLGPWPAMLEWLLGRGPAVGVAG
jgi:uncharacterized protein